MDLKTPQAYDIINRCLGTNGVWASPDRYRYQCWTRDFCLAICQLLLEDSNLVNHEIIYKQLSVLVSKQRQSGQIPILYLDDEEAFIQSKEQRLKETGKTSFMLRRYREGQLENLTPHTRDSEILFIITVHVFKISQYGRLYDCRELLKASYRAMNYVRSILVDGLVPGADWRDTREDLDQKCVLTNACLLFKAYHALGDFDAANHVHNLIQIKYWNGSYFVDYESNNSNVDIEPKALHKDFDQLGNALAIIFGIADQKQSESICRESFKYATLYGLKSSGTYLPPLNREEVKLVNNDQYVIWPFIGNFMLLAMSTLGPEWILTANSLFSMWEQRNGFYEWYDPVSGKGYGSPDQLWSVAMYLRVKNRLN